MTDRFNIKKDEFVLLKHNPETDVWVYERTYGHRVKNIKKCIEVVKPVWRERDGERIPIYPATSQFGEYGYCLNSNDYWLKEKLEFYLANGLKHFTPPVKRP